MVNKSAKGRAKETLCAKELVANGYVILFKSQRVRFGRIDFGPFDIVAAHGHKGLIFISVKHSTSGDIAKNRREIENFWLTHGCEFARASFELWIWYALGYRGRGKKRRWDHAHWKKELLGHVWR